MAKHLTQSEIKKAILDGMCKAIDERGWSIKFTSDEDLLSMLPDGVQKGRFELALHDLLSARDIELTNGSYHLRNGIYEEYVEREEPDIWQPIKVEKHEEVAGEIEEFSTAIKAENGLKVSHPDETDFVIETADATAKSLRDKEGVITEKRLSALIDGLRRILKIGYKVARIVARASALIELINLLL